MLAATKFTKRLAVFADGRDISGFGVGIACQRLIAIPLVTANFQSLEYHSHHGVVLTEIISPGENRPGEIAIGKGCVFHADGDGADLCTGIVAAFARDRLRVLFRHSCHIGKRLGLRSVHSFDGEVVGLHCLFERVARGLECCLARIVILRRVGQVIIVGSVNYADRVRLCGGQLFSVSGDRTPCDRDRDILIGHGECRVSICEAHVDGISILTKIGGVVHRRVCVGADVPCFDALIADALDLIRDAVNFDSQIAVNAVCEICVIREGQTPVLDLPAVAADGVAFVVPDIEVSHVVYVDGQTDLRQGCGFGHGACNAVFIAVERKAGHQGRPLSACTANGVLLGRILPEVRRHIVECCGRFGRIALDLQRQRIVLFCR